jgi:primosomal protein N' (replication factor Y)
LTAQVYRLFKARFGGSVAIIHSGLSDGERFDEYKRILNGEATVVIGARSAIFSPLTNIGIIIIDEEHDSSYISEGNPRFDTETVAEFRVEHNGATLILGSATPSVETYYRCQQGEYKLINMVARVNEKQMPVMEIVDMCKELRCGNTGIFSTRLQEALRYTVESGNQAMIYINRRGFASFVMCCGCGYVGKCGDCDVSLTYHSEDNLLKCHYCGKRYKMLTECPECACKKIRYGRVGTEKVVGEIKKLIPSARILRMDNDSTREKDGHQKILSAFHRQEADILVGTQMISKGHDFPNVTLVGILDADMSLYFSDFRSNERTFQLVTQVSGRAGREKKSGEVILQTFAPRHYVFRFASGYDYVGFYNKEINSREVTKYPPFTRIVRVLVTSADEDASMNQARKIYGGIRDISLDERYAGNFAYLQAMKSPIKRIQSKYRYQILMRLKNDGVTDGIIQEVYRIADGEGNKNCSVFVEINSQNLN